MEVISGKKFKPFAVIIGGVAGVGKTTWAAAAPKPLFICGDEVSELDVDRLPQVKSWDDFVKQLTWVKTTRPKYETLVIDTLDNLEKLLHKKIVDEDPKSSGAMAKAMGGFGKAYEAAERAMLNVRDELIKPIRDELGMNIVLIVHSKKVMATDVEHAMQFDTQDMCLHQKAISCWSDWVSGIFFANFVTHKVEGENTDKVFLTGDGERVLYTSKKPSHFGKNRWGLPDQLPLEFNEFYSRFKKFYEQGEKLTPEQVVASIVSLSENIKDDALKAKVVESVQKAGNDLKKLTRILDRVGELTV